MATLLSDKVKNIYQHLVFTKDSNDRLYHTASGTTDAEITSLNVTASKATALNTSSNGFVKTTSGNGTISIGTLPVPIADGGTAATSESGARTNLGLAIGGDVQAYDLGLTSIAGLTTASDKMIYTTDLDTYAITTLTSAGRNILDDADATAQRVTLGLEIGVDVQRYDAQLQTISSWTVANAVRGIADDNTVEIDDADVANEDYAQFTTNGLQGKTLDEMLLTGNIKIGEDNETKIDFESANTINFYANTAKEMVIQENIVSPGTSDGTALGSTSLMWSDLFLATGGVVNWNNGDVTLTHSSNDLAVGGGTLTADGGVKVDNITIDGTEIDLSSGNLTIDVAGTIELNADGGSVNIMDDDQKIANIGTNKIQLWRKPGATTEANDCRIILGDHTPGGSSTYHWSLGLDQSDLDSGIPKFKIHASTGGVVSDPSRFELDKDGNLTIEGTFIAPSLDTPSLTADAIFVGTGGADGIIKSTGNHDVYLRTGATDTGEIRIVDGTNEDLFVTPHGSGTLILGADTGTIQLATDDIRDANDNPWMGGTFTSSAVNNMNVINAASGNHPGFSAVGDNANINIDLIPKGTGYAGVVKTGPAKTTAAFFTLENQYNAADMDGTGTSMYWLQRYYDASTPLSTPCGSLSMIAENDWTSTASTRDATFEVKTALNGSIVKQLEVTSAGNLTATGTISAGTISEVGSDTDKFLISDSGEVKYVTGANLASYIGAATNHITNDAADVMTVSNFGPNAALKIDADQPATTLGENSIGLHIDYVRAVATGGTNAHNDLGIDLDVTAATLGTGTVKGMDIDVVGATSGTHTATGIELNVSAADDNIGLAITTPDAGPGRKDIRIYSDSDAADYCNIYTGVSGATTIETVDGGGTQAVLSLIADGTIALDSASNITLDSASGRFSTKHNGTEFSVANSAWAGMILGYNTLGIDATTAGVTLGTSFSVIDSNHKVKFVAPPSGVVEIFVSVFMDVNRRTFYFGLSDNATYNAVDVTHEHVIMQLPGSADDRQVNHRWVITGLTSGTAYEYWLGAKATYALSTSMKWGGDATGEYQPFVMQAKALPTAVADYAVYG